jgi:hypothetical protein
LCRRRSLPSRKTCPPPSRRQPTPSQPSSAER